nr:MAG TPA: hypothetical protein [Caudoviricetes sp.]
MESDRKLQNDKRLATPGGGGSHITLPPCIAAPLYFSPRGYFQIEPWVLRCPREPVASSR